MKFNSRGQAAQGLGVRWVTDDRTIRQDCTGPRCKLVDQHGNTWDERGATYVAGNGGKWAAMLQSVPVQSFSNFGYNSNEGWIWDISLDGQTVIECPNYQDGRTVGILGQPSTYITGPGVAHAAAFNGGFVATFHDRTLYHSQRGWQKLPNIQPFVVACAGDFVVYHTHQHLILQKLGTLQGKVIASTGATFLPDIIQLGNAIHVGWSTNPADQGPLGSFTYRIGDPLDDISGATDWAIVVPQPPPVPPSPSPKPEPPKVEPITFPERVQQIVEALYERNLTLAESKHDDDRRILARMIAEQVRFELGDEWGWKSNHGVGISPSKDAIAKRIGPLRLNERQTLHIWDLFNGDSRKPYSFPESKVSDQFFIPVEPVNHLGATKPPVEPTEPPVPLPNNSSFDALIAQVIAEAVTPLKAEIAALKVRLNDAELDIQDLEAELPGDIPEVKLPKRISLRSIKDGKYLCADHDNVVRADREHRGSWEIFDFEIVE